MKKIHWKKQKGAGNYTRYMGVVIISVFGEITEFVICTVEQFKKGEYCLPQTWFPRDASMKRQTTKTLEAAKKKCKMFFKELILQLS